MASDVDICNAALSHLGDSANVTSIDPPDGSTQARYCAQFYPLAVAALLEGANWGFATMRSALAPLTVNPACPAWRFAYAYPANLVKLLSILRHDAIADYTANFGEQRHEWDSPQPDFANPAENMYMPQPYVTEQDGEGNQIILTNTWGAIARYTIHASDSTKFSPLFVLALSYLLASMLAGPILKGEAGAEQSAAMLKMSQGFQAQASTSDANQRHVKVEQRVSWMAGR